jgi:hypothetical protein
MRRPTTPIYDEDVLRSSMGDGDRKAEGAPTGLCRRSRAPCPGDRHARPGAELRKLQVGVTGVEGTLLWTPVGPTDWMSGISEQPPSSGQFTSPTRIEVRLPHMGLSDVGTNPDAAGRRRWLSKPG